jgi:sugar phosphate isomerase/epimerase
MAAPVQLTMLNGMADQDIARAIQRHVEWKLRWLDLKDMVLGKSVSDLNDEEARAVRSMADAAGLGVSTMSTVLFHDDIEKGERVFRDSNLRPLSRALEVARILRAERVRLLAARTFRGGRVRASAWLLEAYRGAIDQIEGAGFLPVIENEVNGCLWSRPEEIVEFFASLDRPRARLVWDIQNLWQMGTFPSLAVYRDLRPLIGMVHVKGGMADRPGGPLKWSAVLADASWPVVEILRAVVADGVSPVICLNPSHGEKRPGYDCADAVDRDIVFLRANIPEIE